MYYDLDIPSYDFCKEMYHATGAFVTPGDCFQQERCVRVGYACDRQTLVDGLEAMSASWLRRPKAEPRQKKTLPETADMAVSAAFSVVSQDGRLFSLAGSPRQPAR